MGVCSVTCLSAVPHGMAAVSGQAGPPQAQGTAEPIPNTAPFSQLLAELTAPGVKHRKGGSKDTLATDVFRPGQFSSLGSPDSH